MRSFLPRRRKTHAEPGRHTPAGVHAVQADEPEQAQEPAPASDPEATMVFAKVSDPVVAEALASVSDATVLQRVRDGLSPAGPVATLRALGWDGTPQTGVNLSGHPEFAGYALGDDGLLATGIHLGSDDEGWLCLDVLDDAYLDGLAAVIERAKAVRQQQRVTTAGTEAA